MPSVRDIITDNADILTNIANNLAPVHRLITGFAYLMGLVFAFKSLSTLREYGEQRTMMSSQRSMKEPLVYMIAAAVFVYLPTAIDVAMMTTFGSTNILQYAPISSNNQTIDTLFGPGSLVGRSLTMIIQTIGLIAFIRGWVLVTRSSSSGQQPGGVGKGLVHVLGGIMALNFVETITIINNTLYG